MTNYECSYLCCHFIFETKSSKRYKDVITGEKFLKKKKSNGFKTEIFFYNSKNNLKKKEEKKI